MRFRRGGRRSFRRGARRSFRRGGSRRMSSARRRGLRIGFRM